MSIGNLNLSNLLYGNQSISTDMTNSSYGNILSPNAKNIDTSIFAKAIDTNKDGKISSEEFQAFLDNPSGILQNANSAKNNQDSSNSILQLILSLLTKALGSQQTEQQSSVKNTYQASAPVSNINNTTVSNNTSINTAAADTTSAKTIKTNETKDKTAATTIENSSLSNKKAYSKTIETLLEKETSSGKEVLEEKSDYKIGRFYDEKGVITKEVYYAKETKNKDKDNAVYHISYFEDGKETRSVTTKAISLGATSENLYDKNGNCIEHNAYDANGKLTSTKKMEFNDKKELLSVIGETYDANGKLTESKEDTITRDEEITNTNLTKYYDEDGNVIKTHLRQLHSDKTEVLTDFDKDGNVISDTSSDTVANAPQEELAAPEETFNT